MTITYSTNWMGPVALWWYRDRGLTKIVNCVMEKDGTFNDLKKGDEYQREEIIEHWAGGRIDIYGTGDMYGDEVGLPIMHGADYNKFSHWLDTLKTDEVWTLDQIVDLYERDNPPIRWADDHLEEKNERKN